MKPFSTDREGRCFGDEGGPWNGQLLHVEQFEIGRNGAGFRCFLTVKSMVLTAVFTVARTVTYGCFHRGRWDGGESLGDTFGELRRGEGEPIQGLPLPMGSDQGRSR